MNLTRLAAALFASLEILCSAPARAADEAGFRVVGAVEKPGEAQVPNFVVAA